MDVIKVVELLNGEKLVGVVSQYNTVTIKNPVVIAPQKQDDQGNVTFALIEWPLFKDKDVETYTVSETAIVTMYEPNSQVLAHYNRVMAQKAGLVLPPSIKPVTQLLQE